MFKILIKSHLKMEDSSKEFCFQNKTYSNEFSAQLNTLRKSGVFCDVVLISSDGVEFPVHRAVLAAGCVYFNVLFNINMVEKQQTRVHLKTISSSALRKVLEYIYTGSLRLNNDCVSELLLASSMLLMFELTDYCWDIFVKTLDLKNCISRKILADTISSESIAKTVTSFVLKNFVNLDSESLADCPVSILREILSCKELVVDSEVEVLGILLKWLFSCSLGLKQENEMLNEDSNISKLCKELLSLVRFKFIALDRKELIVFLQSFSLSKHPWLRDAVLARFETKSGSTESRLSYKEVDVVVVVGGQGEYSVLNQVHVYVPPIDQWVGISSMHHPRKSFGLVLCDNALYAVGGTMEKSADSPVSFIECYHSREDTWEEIHVTSSSELDRDSAGIVGSHDQIVISGGFRFTSCSVTSSVVELNPANREWRELTSLHTAREGHVAIADDVSIYVIGGKNQSGYLASVERYNKDTETWNVLAPMNNNRAHACAVRYKKNLYVFGGYDGENVLNSAEVYDPTTNQWQLLLEGMATPRMKFAVNLCGDAAFVIGGMIGPRGPMTCEVEEYNLVTSTWSNVSSMNEKKMELNSANLSLRNNVIANFMRE